MSLIDYPSDFLDAARIIIGRLREDGEITAERAIHAAWHLGGVALHYLAKDEDKAAELMQMSAPVQHATGWKKPCRAAASLADQLEEDLVKNMEPVTGIGWLSILLLLWDIIRLFTGGEPEKLDWIA